MHPAFHQMIDQCVSGQLIAMEVRQDDVVQSFKALCGPMNSEVARVQAPTSIRAIHGIDKVMNAVHCTDLASDGVMEVEYFFVILESRTRNE